MQKLLKDYIYHLEFKENKKYNTIISVKNDIENFLNYFLQKNINDVRSIDFLMLKEYFYELRDSEVSISTFNRRLSSLKKFYKYLKSNDLVTENITLPLENIKNNEKKIEYLTDEEIKKFRTAIEGNNFNAIRDRFLFELLYSTGITVSELLSLGEQNFLIEQREIQFFKNKKKRFLFFSENCKFAYEKYLKIKEDKFKTQNNKNILFINNSNQRLTDRSIRRIISKYKEKAQIEKEFSTYTIRHTFCITMLKNGMPKEYLGKLLDMSGMEQLIAYEKIIRRDVL
ncbi:MAG: tyrosine-type recombinase/integrase [Fusobacterium sp.]|uniref:tyrosine-type recombinase/integrase n=1 Tax=Fusobacterium sp. TaxID=68766 RepID=UPI0026DDBB5E|nr:tyrosine-type recombinase/integrase [Fusobacterium sp.]MDO4690206.1 tyrosine-type recombinase/integrase [Fusobacterium sp.]